MFFFSPSLEVVVLVFFAVMYEMGIKDASSFFLYFLKVASTIFAKKFSQIFFFFVLPSFEVVVLVFLLFFVR